MFRNWFDAFDAVDEADLIEVDKLFALLFKHKRVVDALRSGKVYGFSLRLQSIQSCSL